MAVITKFVVVREGVEKMTFTSKKEADAYDKMLDIADNLVPFITSAELKIDENSVEKLAFYLASNKDELANLLKGVVKAKPAVKPAAKKAPKKAAAE
ncbi:YebG family protein [Shewanella sp. 1_MG-2023]|uniref:YebG family protein n=1 Tax=unclassified Shewanella TaxID=196818 RepID=UPI0026E208AD|nr:MULTISPECIES: YebG family protein [unclassified Shewanella]MDO6611818.1 YebG family protein [Shewanella sp. 7_MG-2023]MDO6771673.1 YebG family protein [Shewanella sp. 2_MG-2023]MDO6793899.1 YebG family protein [Shewanella sp. 1_MG-2023]